MNNLNDLDRDFKENSNVNEDIIPSFYTFRDEVAQSRMRRNWTVADFSPYASTDKVHDDEVSSISALHKADSGEDLIPQIPQRSSKRPSQKPKPDSDSQIEALTISSPTPGPENYLPPAQYESQEQIIQRINEANEQFRRSKASQTPSSNTNSGRGARQGRGSLGKAVDKFKNVFTNHRIGSNGKSHHECNNRDSSDLHGSEDMNSMRKVDGKVHHPIFCSLC